MGWRWGNVNAHALCVALLVLMAWSDGGFWPREARTLFVSAAFHRLC